MSEFQFSIPIGVVSKSEEPLSLAQARLVLEMRLANGEPLEFEGVASSTALDREHEWMTEACIKSMARQAPVDIIAAPAQGRHMGVEPGRELGVAKSFSVFNDGDRIKLGVSGELNPTVEQARAVYTNALAGQRYELSVMGQVKTGLDRHPETGAMAKSFRDIKLDHIAVARSGRAINPDAWLTAVSKACDLETVSAEEEGIVSKAISERSWGSVDKSALPRSAFLVQADNWSDCKLPVYEADTASPKDEEGHYTRRGDLNANAVRAALAAVAGGRTGKAMEVSQDVLAELNALAERCGINASKSSEVEIMGGVPEICVEVAPEQMLEAVPVVQIEPYEDRPVSAVFTDNANRASAIERFAAVAYEFDPLVEQLRLTLRGICVLESAEERQELLKTALADFGSAVTEAVAESISKAGARHSVGDTGLLHQAQMTLQDVCGCGDCAGAVDALREEAASKAASKAAAEVAGEEIGMTPEEMQAVISAAVSALIDPLVARIGEIEKSLNIQGETPPEDAATPPPEASKALPAPECAGPNELERRIDELTAERNALASKAAALAAQPSAGGPANTAADEGDGRLSGQGGPDIFAETCSKARTGNPADRFAAVNEANAQVAEALVFGLLRRPVNAE